MPNPAVRPARALITRFCPFLNEARFAFQAMPLNTPSLAIRHQHFGIENQHGVKDPALTEGSAKLSNGMDIHAARDSRTPHFFSRLFYHIRHAFRRPDPVFWFITDMPKEILGQVLIAAPAMDRERRGALASTCRAFKIALDTVSECDKFETQIAARIVRWPSTCPPARIPQRIHALMRSASHLPCHGRYRWVFRELMPHFRKLSEPERIACLSSLVEAALSSPPTARATPKEWAVQMLHQFAKCLGPKDGALLDRVLDLAISIEANTDAEKMWKGHLLGHMAYRAGKENSQASMHRWNRIFDQLPANPEAGTCLLAKGLGDGGYGFNQYIVNPWKVSQEKRLAARAMQNGIPGRQVVRESCEVGAFRASRKARKEEWREAVNPRKKVDTRYDLGTISFGGGVC
jgi:hypothetical protein